MKRLNLVGAGKLGQTLAHLFKQQHQFDIGDIVNRSLTSAQKAQQFIGAGRAVEQLSQTAPADIWLIATADGEIATTAAKIYQLEHFKGHEIVFHCSGSLGSDILSTDEQATHTASIHPIHSFANPQQSLETFSGSHCAYEGNSLALTVLLPAFESIGAQLLAVDGEQKSLYHAASVMACNYLVALMDASLSCFELAGIAREQAQQLLLPITHATLDNTLKHSPTSALTGPIARGDLETVRQQMKQLEQHPQLAAIYQQLGLQALDVATRQGLQENRQQLAQLLQPSDKPV
jgi:predicted short-subunit dehydrogenase-like oxidoreductase (DUF2520 family)